LRERTIAGFRIRLLIPSRDRAGIKEPLLPLFMKEGPGEFLAVILNPCGE
jgi:hypothetical protein